MEEKMRVDPGGTVLITVVLLASLKVMGVLARSWWWVLAPVWLGLAGVVAVVVLVGLVMTGVVLMTGRGER
jgi:hypothetical protein